MCTAVETLVERGWLPVCWGFRDVAQITPKTYARSASPPSPQAKFCLACLAGDGRGSNRLSSIYSNGGAME